MFEENKISGRAGVPISLTGENFEYLNYTCIRRGERSRRINTAIDEFIENGNLHAINRPLQKNRVGVTVSFTPGNYQYLKDRCRRRGERSWFVNAAIDFYRETEDTRIIGMIKRICDAYKLNIIPLINVGESEEIAFVLKKCFDHNIKHPQLGLLVPDILKTEFESYYSTSVNPVVVAEPNSTDDCIGGIV